MKNLFDSLHDLIIFSSKDYALTPDDAWLWGIIAGWDDDSLREFEQKNWWNVSDSKRLKIYHSQFENFRVNYDGN